MRRRRWPLLIGALVVALVLGLSACGSSSKSKTSGAAGGTTSTATAGGTTSTPTVSHAKTKFVLHAGLAFGAFHRWIYKPLKAGDFRHPASHKVTTIKGVLAAAFVYHQLKLALAAARADPTLSHLVAPITDVQNKLHSVGSSLKGGHVDASQIEGVNGSIGAIHGKAAAAGQPITEQTPASP